MWCRSQQCLARFTMLLVERSSETELFRHLSNHVFGVCKLVNTKAVREIFFLKYSKDLHKMQQKFEKEFFVSKIIWIGIVKFSLLRKGYFLSVSETSSKVWHVNKGDFFYSKRSLLLTCKILGLLLNTLATDEKYLVLNRDNLKIPIQMQLSRKQKLFLNLWLHFWNLA